MTSSTKANINLENRYDRVIVLIDMDCFYCQVEEKLNPDLVGKPIAVVQYNAWRGGGIIAVNYPARAKGVTRHMRGEEAQEHCPEINLVRVPNVREKADLTKYREAGKRVAEVLQTYTPLLERASVDEAYLDITEQVKIRLKELNDGTYKIASNSLENTFAVGYESVGLFVHEISSNELDTEGELPAFQEDELHNLEKALLLKYNLKLLIGATIVSEIRAKVKEKTGYECSAGIAHNKILAKLACGINKPNKQTILSINETATLLQSLAIHKIKGLGGKFGEDIIDELKIKTIGDLLQFSKSDLQKKYDEKNGNWLFLIARGIDLELVVPRFYSKSIGCCKKFPGRNAITGINTLIHWFNELSNEIADRLDKDIVENNRKAKQMVVSFIQEINANDVSSSRSGNLISYDPDIISKAALDILQKNTNQFFKPDSTKILNNPIKFLGISVGKFENISSGQSTLQEMFCKQQKKIENQQLDGKESKTDSSKLKIDNEIKKSYALDVTEKNVELIPNTNSSVLTENIDVTTNVDCLSQNTEYLKKLANTECMIESRHTKIEPSIKTLFDSQKTNIISDIDIPTCTNKEMENKRNCDETITSNIEEPSTSSALDYTKTYAEYTIIQPMEENLVDCSECENKVLPINFQTHLDGHLAFKLSQQLREEYRNELKTQFSQNATVKHGKNVKKSQLNNSPALKSKSTKTTKPVTSPAANITKYLKPSEKASISDMRNCVKCAECGCFVDELKVFEHKDLHLAQKIQREWNQT